MSAYFFPGGKSSYVDEAPKTMAFVPTGQRALPSYRRNNSRVLEEGLHQMSCQRPENGKP